MKTTLSTSQAIDLLMQDGYANWTFAQAEKIMEIIEECEGELDTEIEFDRTAIRCQFAGYDTLADVQADYHSTKLDMNYVYECADGTYIVDVENQ